MLAICNNWVGDMSFPRHHTNFDSQYPSQPWESPEPQFDYTHYSQQSYPQSLAYRPRLDGYPFPAGNSYMASPMEAPSQPTPTSEYPEDPSFDTNSDGRLEMGQDEIDAIIRNKRKVRDPKACYACHRRKVKCNRELPCDSCVKRDHPELCSYERPTKRRRIALTSQFPHADGQESKPTTTQSGPNITVPKETWERINHELQQLREQLNDVPADQVDEASGQDYNDRNVGGISRSSDDVERDGIYAPSNQMGTMHLGSRSVLAYMMGLGRSKSSQDATRSLLEENILPKLGLDNESVTYPFVDLWSTDHSMQDINGLCSAIPDDGLCRDFFYAYRDVARTIYPVVPDPSEFEHEMNKMLRNRAETQANSLQIDQTNPFGISLSFLALVFAVFASGAQCTSAAAKARELTSQVYTCCSYQALRMSNFMTHPNLETIQASLIIGNVLAYNMNPGVAYIFLGMVIRMAFSIGLHMNTAGFSEKENWLRRRVWWALAWQDSHFSISYDRPSASALCRPDIPYSYGSVPGNRSYAESMYSIIDLTQEIIRNRSFGSRSQMNWMAIQRYKETVNTIVQDGVPHLRERSLCLKITQHLERLALKLHSSYITSELCRPALKEITNESALTPTSNTVQTPPTSNRRKGSGSQSSGPAHSPSITVSDLAITVSQLRRECIRSLEGTVEAYVELHSLSAFAARSWIGIQRAISAAFLLGTLPETNQEPTILNLLRELEECIAQRTMDDPAFERLRAEDGRLYEQRGQQQQQQQGHLNPVEGLEPTESPHWARSMTRSLNALGKLNATLADCKAGTASSNVGGFTSRAGGGDGSSNYPTPTTTTGGFGSVQQQTNAMASQRSLPPLPTKRGDMHSPGKGRPYSTNTNVQMSGMGSGSGGTRRGHLNLNTNPTQTGWGGMSSDPITSAGGVASGNPSQPGRNDTGSAGAAGVPSDWNLANLKERSAEYIQPALWR